MPGLTQKNKGVIGTFDWSDCKGCKHSDSKNDCTLDIFKVVVNLDIEFESTLLCGLYETTDEE